MKLQLNTWLVFLQAMWILSATVDQSYTTTTTQLSQYAIERSSKSDEWMGLVEVFPPRVNGSGRRSFFGPFCLLREKPILGGQRPVSATKDQFHKKTIMQHFSDSINCICPDQLIVFFTLPRAVSLRVGQLLKSLQQKRLLQLILIKRHWWFLRCGQLLEFTNPRSHNLLKRHWR